MFEVLRVRFKTWLKTLVRLFGIGLVLLGAYNALAAPLFEMGRLFYYPNGPIAITPRGGIYYIYDAIVICAGAAVTIFV